MGGWGTSTVREPEPQLLRAEAHGGAAPVVSPTWSVGRMRAVHVFLEDLPVSQEKLACVPASLQELPSILPSQSTKVL